MFYAAGYSEHGSDDVDSKSNPPLIPILDLWFGRFFCQNLSAASQEKSQAAHSEPTDVNMPAVAVPGGGEVS